MIILPITFLLAAAGSAYGTCGVTSVQQGRIINGKDAIPGAWPWIASFQRNYRHFCGGTLLTPKWVLTASHCVSKITPENMFRYTVKLGAHNHKISEESVQRRRIKRVIVNPHWDRKQLIGDVTLLELESPVTLNSRVNTVCLPQKGVYPKLGTECYVAGWGSITYPGKSHYILQQVKLPVVVNKYCHNNPEVVCVGLGFKPRPDGTQQPNACRGDSGGPLVRRLPDGRWQLDGVASYVYEYCKYYTAYAPVNKYLDWINSYIHT